MTGPYSRLSNCEPRGNPRDTMSARRRPPRPSGATKPLSTASLSRGHVWRSGLDSSGGRTPSSLPIERSVADRITQAAASANWLAYAVTIPDPSEYLGRRHGTAAPRAGLRRDRALHHDVLLAPSLDRRRT